MYISLMCTARAIETPIAPDMEEVLASRRFGRWFRRNSKKVAALALAAPAFTFTLFQIDAQTFEFLRKSAFMVAQAAPVFEPSTPPYYPYAPPNMVPVNGNTGIGQSFFQTHGVILLHMLIMGFLTLVVSTFLRFTGRGDLIPLIAFVGGGAILLEVLGLFMAIYKAVMEFLYL